MWGQLGEYKPGDFGDFSAFSLTKIFKITYCGMLKIKKRNLINDAKKILLKKISLIERIEHIKGIITYLSFYSKKVNKRSK